MSVAPALRVALEAAVHAGNPGDVAFYLRACAGAERVLELGCGAGRVARALHDAGHRVTGIDVDVDALEVAAALGVTARRADMRAFSFDERFDRVIVPFSGLYCLLRADDVMRCLASAKSHLSPGGSVVFDAYGADTFHEQPEDDSVDEEDLVVTVDVDGTCWEVFERSRWWRGPQRIDAWYRYVAADGRPGLEACIRQRYLLSTEVPGLLARAGFALRSMHGGFDGEPWDAGASLLVVDAVPA